MSQSASELKSQILRLTREYSALVHQAQRPGREQTALFNPGETTVPYVGRVFTADEVEAAVGATLDFWLTLGPEGAAFESELASFLGVKYSLLVNSGSSANLVAFSTLTSHKLPAERRIVEEISRGEGKPEAALPKIVEGRLGAFFKQVALLEQDYARDNKLTITQVLAQAGLTVSGFARFKVGA